VLNLKLDKPLTPLITILSSALFCVLCFELTVHTFLTAPFITIWSGKRLPNYFEYGRSAESKLIAALGKSDDAMTAVSKAGWIEKECRKTIKPIAGKRVISVYGMSFSGDIAAALHEIDPSFVPINFAGPGAPPSHTYRCYLEQLRFSATGVSDESEVQIIGILASAVAGMLSTTGATVGFESPAAFTYPRYRIVSGILQEQIIPIQSAADWRHHLNNPQSRARLLSQLSDLDEFYSPFIFPSVISDFSVTARLLKRAYGQRAIRVIRSKVLTEKGYSDNPDIGPVLSAIVEDIAKRAGSSGKRPIVLLIHDRGSGKALFSLLNEVMTLAGIEYLSTHEIAKPSDPRNFISDGHLTKEANLKVAKALQKLLVQKRNH
jgi:hypothetical protein